MRLSKAYYPATLLFHKSRDAYDPQHFGSDIGTDIDDAPALVLAVHSPEINIQSVTAVGGDVRLRGRIASGSRGGAPEFWHSHDGHSSNYRFQPSFLLIMIDHAGLSRTSPPTP